MPKDDTLLGDKGYNNTAIREAVVNKNVWVNIPSRANRKKHFAFSA